MNKAVPEKLPKAEWNFDDVPEDELWACLIWEYGRTSGKKPAWIHRRARVSVIERKPAPPPPAVTLLARMLHQQFEFVNCAKVPFKNFFPDTPWLSLPPLTRANMALVVFDQPLISNLERIHKILRDHSLPPKVPKTKREEERRRAAFSCDVLEMAAETGKAQHWLSVHSGASRDTVEPTNKPAEESALKYLPLGVTGFDDISEAVIHDRLCLRYFREDVDARAQGIYAAAFRINWNLGRTKLVKKFNEWLDDQPEFSKYDGKSWPRPGPEGIVLSVDNGEKMTKTNPRTALGYLGTLRAKEAYGDWKSCLRHICSDFHDEVFNLKSASVGGIDACSFARQIRDQLFPKTR